MRDYSPQASIAGGSMPAEVARTAALGADSGLKRAPEQFQAVNYTAAWPHCIPIHPGSNLCLLVSVGWARAAGGAGRGPADRRRPQRQSESQFHVRQRSTTASNGWNCACRLRLAPPWMLAPSPHG